MPHAKMHADELEIDADLVRRLLAAQFPEWAELPLERVRSAGTDNAIFRLGDDLVVRLPRIHWATKQPAVEHAWLPRLAPHLPLAIPEPLAHGGPGEGYPWQWSVHRWLDGEPATSDRLADLREAAATLGRFAAALHRVEPAHDAPRSPRGHALEQRDAGVRAALEAVQDTVDAGELTAAWEAALAVPPFRGPPTWVHGDLLPGNLLAVGGRLSAVIDFGCVGVGDPAVDAMAAWTTFDADTRDAYRAALAVDDATWNRGRGWAICFAVAALPYYIETNPVLAGVARHALEEVIAERGA